VAWTFFNAEKSGSGYVKKSITLTFSIESYFTWQLTIDHFRKYVCKISDQNAKQLLRKQRKTLGDCFILLHPVYLYIHISVSLHRNALTKLLKIFHKIHSTHFSSQKFCSVQGWWKTGQGALVLGQTNRQTDKQKSMQNKAVMTNPGILNLAPLVEVPLATLAWTSRAIIPTVSWPVSAAAAEMLGSLITRIISFDTFNSRMCSESTGLYGPQLVSGSGTTF